MLKSPLMSVHRHQLFGLLLVLGLNSWSSSLCLYSQLTGFSLVVLSDVHALPSAIPDVNPQTRSEVEDNSTFADKFDFVCDGFHKLEPTTIFRDVPRVRADPFTQSLVACFQYSLETTDASSDPELRALIESVLTGKASFVS